MNARSRFLIKTRRVKGCLLWTGSCLFWNGERTVSPMRFAYTEWVGQPKPGAQVYRTCGNLACVEPKHLQAGRVFGELHGRSKLTPHDVAKIRKQYVWWGGRGKDKKNTLTDIAQRFGVSVPTILNVVKHKTWNKI